MPPHCSLRQDNDVSLTSHNAERNSKGGSSTRRDVFSQFIQCYRISPRSPYTAVLFIPKVVNNVKVGGGGGGSTLFFGHPTHFVLSGEWKEVLCTLRETSGNFLNFLVHFV